MHYSTREAIRINDPYELLLLKYNIHYAVTILLSPLVLHATWQSYRDFDMVIKIWLSHLQHHLVLQNFLIYRCLTATLSGMKIVSLFCPKTLEYCSTESQKFIFYQLLASDIVQRPNYLTLLFMSKLLSAMLPYRLTTNKCFCLFAYPSSMWPTISFIWKICAI